MSSYGLSPGAIRPMHLLLIAPGFPPHNSPEASQADRFLKALDPSVRVTLVTTAVMGRRKDNGTPVPSRPGMRTITLSLPFQSLMTRPVQNLTRHVVFNRRFGGRPVPDPYFWLPWFSTYVMARLGDVPDVIYSRSMPLSSALLGRRLKQRLGRPWMMHLSDPWSANPYREFPPRKAALDRALEAACFADADRIIVLTEGQAAHYRTRYPDRAEAIRVIPLMMALTIANETKPRRRGALRLVHTGTFYGLREPSTLLAAMELLHARAPSEAAQIQVDFYGRMSSEIAARIDATPGCGQHGYVSLEAVARVQAEADILITIEPGGADPMLLHFMPSKNVDYIACGKPILAITPDGSETARLCGAGYGWAVVPDDPAALAEKLSCLARDHMAAKPLPPLPDVKESPFCAASVAATILAELQQLMSAR